jgi:hypothetical protein
VELELHPLTSVPITVYVVDELGETTAVEHGEVQVNEGNHE